MIKIAFVAVLFGLGIASYFALPFEPSIYFTLFALEALVILAILWRYSTKRLIILGYIAVFVLGFANIQLKSVYLSSFSPLRENKVSYIKGQIDYKDFNIRGTPRYILTGVTDFDDNLLFNKARLSSYKSSFKVGQCVEMASVLMPPFKSPFYGAYDFSKKTFYNGIQANGYATSHTYEVECLKNKTSIVSNLRDNIIAKIYKYVPKEEAAIVSALITGEKGKISKEHLLQYRNSGLAHLLSISGMHMSMVAFLMFALMRTLLVLVPNFALKYNIKKISAIFAIIFATFYLLVSGAQIPTQRAYIMVLIVLLGFLFDRQAISVRSISVAALVILIISPEVLVSPSFQMSFAAVLCLIAFYEKFAFPINQFIKKFGFLLSYVIGLVIADFIASLATLPFAIYHFNNVAVYTSLGNILAGPIVAFIVMPFILVSLLAIPFGLEQYPLEVVGYGVKIINKITAYVSGLDGAVLHVLSMPTWAFALIICGGLFLCLWQSNKRLYGLVFIFIGFFSLAFIKQPLAVNIKDASSFEKMLITEKYGNVQIKNQQPYGAVIYKNKIKRLKFNRIWNKE